MQLTTARAKPVSLGEPVDTLTSVHVEPITPSTHAGLSPKNRHLALPLAQKVKESQRPGPTKVVSPIRVDRLAHHLAVIGYPKDKTEYLIQGFTHGFFLGDPFDSEASDIAANNSKMASDHPEVVEMKLEQEINAGRISGPHTSPPFSPFQISPLNVREKSTPGKYRLIHDLSYPYNDESINSKIPDHLKSVKYSSVRDTMATLSRLPKGVYMAKCDIADAYRIIPLHPSEYPKLGMMWMGQYYFDKYLPQGCGSSCRIFEAFSTALEAIFKFYNPVGDVQHMIDDFLFIALTFKKCDALLKAFTQLCDDIGVPLARIRPLSLM